MIKSSIYFLMLIFLASCQNKTFDTIDEVTNYVNDEENEYKYSKIINGVQYQLVYRPTDALVNQELAGRKNSKLIGTLRNKYNKYMYFNLSMSLNDQELLSSVAGDREKFGQIVSDLAFGMSDKVNLYTQEKDTLTMIESVYPRMYGMTNSTSLMIVYPRDKRYLKDEYLNFTVEDLGFNTGEVKIKIKTRALLNEPQLRFN
jgi:hypothetical protein